MLVSPGRNVRHADMQLLEHVTMATTSSPNADVDVHANVITGKKWYFVTKIVLTTVRKNCSSDREKLLKFEAEG